MSDSALAPQSTPTAPAARAGLLEITGAFSVAALVVAVLALPFGKLPTDLGGLVGAAGLTFVVSLALLSVGAIGSVVALVLRSFPRVLLVLALLALALSAKGVELACEELSDWETSLDFGELYDDFHAPIESAFSVLGLGALLALAPARFRRRIGRAGVVAAGVSVLGAGASVLSYGALLPLMSRPLIDSDKLSSFAHKGIVWAFDGDNDGSPRIAGIDCDDADPSVNPMRAEILNNGKDDNCLLGDGTVTASAQPPPPYPRAPLATPVKRVILFAWDAVRADHLSVYGYARDTSPNVAAFAKDAVLFRHASSTAGMTRNFYAGLTSGRYQVPPPSPPRSLFGRDKPGAFERIDTPDVSLFAALGKAGVDRVGCLMHREAHKGFAPGYSDLRCPGCDDEKRRNIRITGPAMLSCAQEVLPAVDRDKPTLIVLHLFDPHGRYRKHKGVPKKWGRKPMGLYDGEIWYADKYFKKAMDLLAEQGLLEDAAVILTSDHGEGFLEHGRSHHGYTAYDEMNRVPLIVRLPGHSGQRWVEQPVENGDVSATLADLFGVADAHLEGVALTGASLTPYLTDPAASAVRKKTIGFAIRTPESSFAITDWPHKAIWDRRLNLWELYDLAADPKERADLARLRPDVIKALRAELEQRVERHQL